MTSVQMQQAAERVFFSFKCLLYISTTIEDQSLEDYVESSEKCMLTFARAYNSSVVRTK